MAEQELYVWTIWAGEGSEPHRTGFTDEIIEEYWWRIMPYFETFLYWFADAEGNTPEVPHAEVNEETQAEVTELVNWLYGTSWGAVGGPFHIVTDDNNLETHHVQYCLNAVDEESLYTSIRPSTNEEKEKCRRFGQLLLSLTVGQREVALRAAEAAEGPY